MFFKDAGAFQLLYFSQRKLAHELLLNQCVCGNEEDLGLPASPSCWHPYSWIFIFHFMFFCATWSITKRERKLLKYFGPHLPFTNKYFVFYDSTLYVTLITLTESLKANQCNSSTEVHFSWKETILGERSWNCQAPVVSKCRIADHWSRHSVENTAVWHPSEKPTAARPVGTTWGWEGTR